MTCHYPGLGNRAFAMTTSKACGSSIALGCYCGGPAILIRCLHRGKAHRSPGLELLRNCTLCSSLWSECLWKGKRLWLSAAQEDCSTTSILIKGAQQNLIMTGKSCCIMRLCTSNNLPNYWGVVSSSACYGKDAVVKPNPKTLTHSYCRSETGSRDENVTTFNHYSVTNLVEINKK